jgi:hypothetical protein
MMNNIELKPPGELIPYVNNAKKHGKEQIKKIAASIKEFGFNNPILIDANNGVIAGHGRLEASQLLGLKEVPTICLDHLSDAQRKAYILADNRLGEVDTEWDMELVNMELEALKDMDFDIELTGFDLFEEDWSSDISAVDNIQASDDPLMAQIKLECEPEAEEVVKSIISEALVKNGIKYTIM